jgi:hypothetical protein
MSNNWRAKRRVSGGSGDCLTVGHAHGLTNSVQFTVELKEAYV